MVDLRDEQDFWPHLIALRDCLCAEIAASGLPSVCYCEVVPGSVNIYDFAEEGMAWVRLVTAYPSVQFPVQDQSIRNCARPLVAQLEIGVVRCAPMMSEGGDPPTAEENFEATRIQMADMAAMRRAVQCCLAKPQHVLGAYTPIGPEGVALGGAWTVYI